MAFAGRRPLQIAGISAGAILGVMLLGVIALVGFYDLREFRPQLPKIDEIYAAMKPEDQQPPLNVRRFVWRVDSGMVDSFVASNLLSDLSGPMGMSIWHYHLLMEELMLRLHFDETRRLALYCHYLPYGQGIGLSNGAQFYFGKDPHELADEQLATLVAIGRSPSANSPTRHPEALERAKARLLEEYSSAR
jgi:hypothetical protein